jgi:hypothetical protein
MIQVRRCMVEAWVSIRGNKEEGVNWWRNSGKKTPLQQMSLHFNAPAKKRLGRISATKVALLLALPTFMAQA